MFFKKTISFFIVLSLLLLTSCSLFLQGENKTDTAASGKKNTIDDIPLTSTIPPYSKDYVYMPDSQKYVVTVFLFDYEEANEVCRLLKENGNDFGYDIINFNYSDDELFSGYWFYGRLTENSYNNKENKRFYELEYEYMAMYGGLFYKDVYQENNNSLGLYGIDNYYESVVESFLTVSLSKTFDLDKECLQNSSKFILTLSGIFEYEYEYDVSYDGELFLIIDSDAQLSYDFFDKIKDTLVVIKDKY